MTELSGPHSPEPKVVAAYYVSAVDLPLGAVIRGYGAGGPLAAPLDDLLEAYARGPHDLETCVRHHSIGLGDYERGNLRTLAAEVIFEAVRRQEFSGKPPRLGSVFLSETIEDAIRFRSEHRGNAHIYRAEVELRAMVHRGDFDHNIGLGGSGVPMREDIELNEAAARAYWRGESRSADPRWELVVPEGLAVVSSSCLDQQPQYPLAGSEA